MATKDLGSIANEPDVRVTSPESVDVLGPLLQTGAAVAEDIKGGIVGASRERMDKAVEEVAAEDQERLAGASEVEFEITEDAQSDAVLNNIRRLQSRVEATSGSSRLRAQMVLRAEIERVGSTLPGLRDELVAEARVFENSDPEYLALQVLDARKESINAVASAELEDIKDFAYKPVANGGLGLVPGLHTFGDREFSQKFAIAGQIREEASFKDLIMIGGKSDASLTLQEKAANFQSWLSAASSPLRVEINSDVALASEYARALINPLSGNNKETIAIWDSSGKQEALNRINELKFGLIQDFNGQFTNLERTRPEFGEVKAIYDAELAALNTLVNGIEANDTNLIQSYEAWDAYRKIAFEQAQPQAVDFARQFEQFKTLFEVSEGAFDNMDLLIKNNAGKYAIQVMDTLPKYLGLTTGLGQVTETTDPSELRRELARNRKNNSQWHETGQQGEDIELTSANLLANVGVQADLLLAEGVTPPIAGTQARARTTALDIYNDSTVLPPDATRDTMVVAVANPKTFDQAVIALEDPTQRTSAVAYGEAAKDLWVRYKPVARARYGTWLGTGIGGLSATGDDRLSIFKADLGDIKNGNVRFVIDDEAIRRRHRTMGGGLELGRIGQAERGSLNQSINIAQERANQMSREVSEDLRIGAHAEALVNGQSTPDYEAQWTLDGLDKWFVTLGGESE